LEHRGSAPLSTRGSRRQRIAPIDWAGARSGTRSNHSHRNLQDRLAKMRADQWKDFSTTKNPQPPTITEAMRKKVGL